MNIPFTKMHGLGNNYIYINTFNMPLSSVDLSQLAVQISDQNTGIGSDGMILIGPSETADVKMRIFNKDGSEAKNCGNGLRCVAKYAYEHALINKTRLSIETLSGIVEAELDLEGESVSTVTVDMGQPILQRRLIPMTGEPADHPAINKACEFSDRTLTAVSMGNPHVLFYEKNMAEAPIETLGPLLSDGHELFPEGVNVGFIEKKSARAIRYRVWERGSGITQACGTGACAAVVASVLENRLEKGQRIEVTLDGGPLFITWKAENEHVLMTGSATTVCEGEYYYIDSFPAEDLD